MLTADLFFYQSLNHSPDTLQVSRIPAREPGSEIYPCNRFPERCESLFIVVAGNIDTLRESTRPLFKGFLLPFFCAGLTDTLTEKIFCGGGINSGLPVGFGRERFLFPVALRVLDPKFIILCPSRSDPGPFVPDCR
ncbi:hypothetical protein ES703_31499 [subsurface metagenome]